MKINSLTSPSEITGELRTELLKHVRLNSTTEACGLVLATDDGLVYFPCRNAADDKATGFMIPAEDYAEAEELGDIVAVFHSHPGPDGLPVPSTLDAGMINESGIPWLICATETEQIGGPYLPTATSLEGRDFTLGSCDCYGLVMAWHRTRGIQLPDFRRPYPWWEKGEELFTSENFAAAGFVEKKDLAVGDMVVFRIASNVTNHCGVYAGDGQILHHLMNRKSGYDQLLGSFLEPRITGILRHEQLPETITWDPNN